jgi:hypothetical protein
MGNGHGHGQISSGIDDAVLEDDGTLVENMVGVY